MVCVNCGIPTDAGFFDESNIVTAPPPGNEAVLARYELHRNYCGMLMYFAQLTRFSTRPARRPDEFRTQGYQWQIRCNGQPRDPYLTFDRIINPWGLSGFPIYLRLEEGSRVELVIRNMGPPPGAELAEVGGRILGRYWYDPAYGGAPHNL
jgi:hypothetical protein